MMYANALSRGFRLIVCGVLLASAATCTDARLRCVNADCAPGDLGSLENKLTAEGEACTADPGVVGYPYKILFIVDVSGSTMQSDPTRQRGPAVQQVLQQYASNSEISFGIIDFDTAPRQLTANFTRDMNLLLPLVPQLNQSLQNTDYVDTLTMARNMIANDANLLTPSERSRTRYDIQWLSDGVPYPCTPLPTILDNQNQLMQLVNTMGLFDIRLSTIFLTGATGDAGTCGSPDGIMMAMANAGRGSYQALTGANLHFKIDFSEIKQPFNKQQFYVVNESRVVKNGRLQPDSDTDGVADEDEKALGTDPTLVDTPNSGCGDRTNQLLQVNPRLCNSICTAHMQNKDPNTLPDTDHDGLKDCAEQALTIKPTKADSDGDNLVDSLEIRFGTSASDPVTLTADSDLDGTVDATEILTGTDPLTAESDRSLAYAYGALAPTTPTVPGTSCFNFSVTNIQLVPTIATPTSKAGDNRICLYLEQLPTGDSSAGSEPTLSRACFIANYQVKDGHAVMIPSSGLQTFKASDFTPIICASGPCK